MVMHCRQWQCDSCTQLLTFSTPDYVLSARSTCAASHCSLSRTRQFAGGRRARSIRIAQSQRSRRSIVSHVALAKRRSTWRVAFETVVGASADRARHRCRHQRSECLAMRNCERTVYLSRHASAAERGRICAQHRRAARHDAGHCADGARSCRVSRVWWRVGAR
jgi:hypothetical protein